jgi:hypothetical protein
MGANDRMWMRYRRAHRPPGNIIPSFGHNPVAKYLASSLQPRSAQITFTPCTYGLPHASATATTPPPRASRPGCPRPRRRGVGHGGGDVLFVRGGEHLLGNRICDGAHQGDAFGAPNSDRTHAHCPLLNSRSQAPLGAIPSSCHAAATAVSTAPRLTLPPEILMRPVRKLRHSARRGVELDPSERQQLRATRSHSTAHGCQRSWPGVRAGYEMHSRSTTAQPA